MKVLLEVDVDLIEGPGASEDDVAKALAHTLSGYDFATFVDTHGDQGHQTSAYTVTAVAGVAETK